MGPIVARLASDFEGRALVGQVDVTTEGSLASAYGVARVPTFAFFKGGREVSRVEGTATYDELAGQVQALLAAP